MKKVMMIMVLATCVGSLCSTHGISAEPARSPVKGSGVTVGIMGMPFSGEGVLIVREKEYVVTIQTQLLGMPEQKGDGTTHAKSSHTFTLYDNDIEIGSFITEDQAVLISTADPMVKKVNSNLIIKEETGLWEGVTGRVQAHGTMTLEPVLDAEGNTILDPYGNPLLTGTTDFVFKGTLSAF